MAGKKTGKRLLTWVLVLVMALSLLPVNALAKPSEKTDWTADIYAVIVDADNKITSINTLTSKEYSGTTEDFTDKGFKWQWNANGNGYTISTTITGPNSNVNASPYMKYPTNLWDYSGKTFEGYTTQNYYPTEGGSVSRMKLNGKGTFDSQWEHNNGIGNNSYSAALALKSKLSVWYVFRDTTPTAPSKPSDDAVKSLLGNAVKVDCINTSVAHADQTYSLLDGSFTVGDVQGSAGSYTCTVTVNAPAYVAKYNGDTSATHTLSDAASKTITLKHDGTKWVAQTDTPIVFKVVCDATPDDPELGKNFVFSADKMVVKFICETTIDHNARYGLKNGYYSVSDKKKSESGKWRCAIEINLNKYFADFYSKDHPGHIRTNPKGEISRVVYYLDWNENLQRWTASKRLISATEIHVKCDATPTEPSKEEVKKLLGDNAVQIICTNDKATHTPTSKGYALIEDSYTSDGVKGDAENGYTYTVTIESEKYVNQFDTDTGAVHTPKNATATVTLEYKKNAWLVKSGTPISFNVVCDAAPTYPVYVYAFFAHNGTPLKGDVTVNGNPIEWNEDANNEYKEYFVTLGVYPNGTTKEPTNGNTGLDLEALKGKKYELFDGTGSGTKNGVALTDITSYPSPSGTVCKGAAGYPKIEDELSWHLDGQVDVYTVTYDYNGGTAQGAPTSNGYYFGSYTIAAAPKRDGYDFTGWNTKKDGTGTTYKANGTLTITDNTTLYAQWKVKEYSFTVNYLWNGEAIQPPTTGEENYNAVITIKDPAIDGYTLIFGQKTSMTIGTGENVLNLNYYKNVTLTANSDTKTYDGTEHTVTGYTAKDNENKAVEGLTFTGVASPSASGTDVGEYDVEFSGSAVGAHNELYIVTAVNPGKLTITPRKVTLTSETASKAYDGTPLTRPNVKVTGDGFVEGEVTGIKATGSVTYVSEGEVTNTIEYTPTDKFKADNYVITKHEGTLKITEAPTYTFNLNDPGIITVNKEFVSKYDRSATMSFTATATIEKQETYTVEVDPNLPINPYPNNRSAVTGEPTYTKVGEATGTVTLKTDTIKAFDFGKDSKFQLQPGDYRITVEETNCNDRYVNYDTNDTTPHTRYFNVSEDGVISAIESITITNEYTKRHTAATPSKPTLNTGDHYAYVMGYPDGMVRPNGSITRAEVSTILFRLLSDKTRDEYFTTESSFTDVKAGAWYNNSIATLEKAGVIVDTAKGGAFRPNEAITRAELAAMLAQFSDAKPVKGVKFSDVSAEHWAYEAIAIAAKMGWIEGYPDGTFRPDATITRAEMMTLVNRALERVPSDEDHLLSKRVMLTFPDCKSGDWFYIAVQEATNSHTYERAATEKNGDEQWTALRANRDWTQLEK